MYSIEFSNRYKKSYKQAVKRGLNVDELNNVVKKLAEGQKLAAKYKDHQLSGTYKDYRECHIQPDWLLVYRIFKDRCLLFLIDTGSHSDIFG